MDLPPGPSRVSRSQSPVRGNKRKILTDEEFVGDSDDNYLASDLDKSNFFL